jgi:hypothetical protein
VAAEEVPEFDCRNWERLHDGRWVAFVYCDKERPRHLGSGLVGRPVIINGKRYVCTRVHRPEIPRPISKGELIGLSIEGEI